MQRGLFEGPEFVLRELHKPSAISSGRGAMPTFKV